MILTTKDYLDSVLDEKEQLYIRNLADSPQMFEAVKKAMLAGLYAQGTLKKKQKNHDPLANSALSPLLAGRIISNEDLGAYVRAFHEGLRWVETCFEGLKSYKTEEKRVENNENPAR